MHTAFQHSRNSSSSHAKKSCRLKKKRKSPRVQSQVYALTLMLDFHHHFLLDFYRNFPNPTSSPGAAACTGVFQISLGVKARKVEISRIYYWILYMCIMMYCFMYIYINNGYSIAVMGNISGYKTIHQPEIRLNKAMSN